jgi:hypothetical protein
MASIKLPLSVAYAIATVLAVAALAVGSHAIASAEDVSIDLSKIYSNAAYGFTLNMPADFSAYPADGAPVRDETGAPEGQAIVLQNSTGDAVQIVVTRDNRITPGSSVLTADDVEQLEPYIYGTDAEPIEIAPGIVGMTFTNTENPVYGSSMEEVWFAYRGNLYQVIADARLDALLEAMMGTWTFI